jgi:hypothetical protein
MLLTLVSTDTYMELVPILGSANWYVSHGIHIGVVVPLAGLMGLKPFYDEYTPERLRGIKKELEESREGKKRV